MAIATSKTKAMAKSAKKATPSADQLSDPKKLAAAGAALMALPFAAQGIAKLTGSAREKVGEGEGKAAEGGGMFGSDDDSDSDEDGGGSAVGSGRRMPIQQSIDVAVPLKVAYNLWTQFEEWPTFMHRVDSVEQVDDCDGGDLDQGLGDHEALRGRDHRAAARRADRVGRRRGAHPQRRRHISRAGAAADPDRGHASTSSPTACSRRRAAGCGSPSARCGATFIDSRHTSRSRRRDEGGWRGTIEDGEVKRKTERKSSGGSRSNGRSSGRSHNGSDPTSGTRKSGSRS